MLKDPYVSMSKQIIPDTGYTVVVFAAVVVVVVCCCYCCHEFIVHLWFEMESFNITF